MTDLHIFEKALEYYDKGLYHAHQFDELPKLTTHTSYLVRGNVLDMSKISAGTEDNEVKRELEYIRGCNGYQKVKDMPRMQGVIAKYEVFEGRRRDYSVR